MGLLNQTVDKAGLKRKTKTCYVGVISERKGESGKVPQRKRLGWRVEFHLAVVEVTTQGDVTDKLGTVHQVGKEPGRRRKMTIEDY